MNAYLSHMTFYCSEIEMLRAALSSSAVAGGSYVEDITIHQSYSVGLPQKSTGSENVYVKVQHRRASLPERRT